MAATKMLQDLVWISQFMNKERLKIWRKLISSGKFAANANNMFLQNGKYTPVGVLAHYVLGEPDRILGKDEFAEWGGRSSTTPEEVVKWLGFSDRLAMYDKKTSKGIFGRLFENDALLQNWDNFKIALDELINE